MTDRELMQRALEALEVLDRVVLGTRRAEESITALRERLAQPEQSPLDRMAENARELGLDYEPVQEPVAWKDRTYGNLHHQDFGNSIPLYTTPPRREWVGLTDTDIEEVWADENLGRYATSYAIEAKLKEKNA